MEIRKLALKALLLIHIYVEYYYFPNRKFC